MRVGEKMSQWVVFESLNWDASGDVFETLSDLESDKPLDIGRLFYVKLRTGLEEDDHVEVYWNHITNLLTIEVESKAGRKAEAIFAPMEMARVDLVQRVDQFVELVKKGIHE